MPVYRSPDEPSPPAPEGDRTTAAKEVAWVVLAVLLLAGIAVFAPADGLRIVAILGVVLVPAFGLGRWLGLWALLFPLPFVIWWIVHVARLEDDDFHGGLAAFVYMFPLGAAILGVLVGAFVRWNRLIEHDRTPARPRHR